MCYTIQSFNINRIYSVAIVDMNEQDVLQVLE
jgi:hypothetical protein